ncbi:NAD(P)H-dependent oxidoreductase [Polaribacter sargassicola]|uniref:NAD(P)H-dependent oxidoreductase n=1 Tax=Polaribacter sargassicola TaxID=2836891 RepID=UPI001F2F9159|nr:NAD(P)H-dependent oxidoreductase [Polaribacter sp. DS7-9]MCG1035561.1 NAD(P)H-dependent oxidoreductase [Polaribacter sp. DS7-9]
MNIIESLKWRYAVKKFDSEKKLSETQINTLKEAFNLTATSYGLQPIKLVIVENKEIKKELVTHSFNQSQIIDASHVLVICVPKNYTITEIDNYFSLVKKLRNTSDEIINPYKEFLLADIKNKTQEELFIWNKNQAYIALGNLMTVCAVEKIDACPMEGFIPQKYDEILELNKHNLKSVLVLPVGYRAGDCYMKDLSKVRKDTQEITIEIK